MSFFRPHLYLGASFLVALICSCLLKCDAYGDIVSHNNISSQFVGHGADKFGQKMDKEINNTEFLKRILLGFDKSPDDIKGRLNARARLAMKEKDDLGLLSMRIELTGLSERTREYAFDQIIRYVELRACGYSKNYVERLMFVEDVTKRKRDLDSMGQAIVDKYPNILPSKLIRLASVDKGTWKVISFEVNDNEYCWNYRVILDKDDRIEDISEVRHKTKLKRR